MKTLSLFLLILSSYAFSTTALNWHLPFVVDNYVVQDIEVTCSQVHGSFGCDKVYLKNSNTLHKTSSTEFCEAATKSLWFSDEAYSFVSLGTDLSLYVSGIISDDLLAKVIITEEMLTGTNQRHSFSGNNYTVSFTITRF